MKKFLALYMAPVGTFDEMMKTSTPEERKESMGQWTAWMEKNKKHFADGGEPAGKNKRVTEKGIDDTRNEVTGYSIVQADSHEAAAALFSDNPMVRMPGAWVDVVELMKM